MKISDLFNRTFFHYAAAALLIQAAGGMHSDWRLLVFMAGWLCLPFTKYAELGRQMYKAMGDPKEIIVHVEDKTNG
jgi:hypothetical protein